MPDIKTTKIDKVKALLGRPKGATADALCKVTGWQAHSVRAALSGLRKAGYTVERTPPANGKGGSIYRICANPKAPE